MTVREIYDLIDRIAPFSEAMDFDNVGLLVGGGNAEVTRAVVCLDATGEVVREAAELSAQLIVSHHPVIFTPLKAVEAGSAVYEAVQKEISIISAHTNLDKAFPFGVNAALAQALGLLNTRSILPDGAGTLGAMGELPKEMSAEAFAEHVKASLGLPHLQYTACSRSIRTAAVISGAGGEYAEEAFRCGADAVVTGEVKHHEFIAAKALGFLLCAAGHYHTEVLYRESMAAYLNENAAGVRFTVSASERPPVEFC